MLTHAAGAPIIVETDPRAGVREEEIQEEKEAESSRLQRARIARGLKFGIPISLGLWFSILWLIFS